MDANRDRLEVHSTFKQRWKGLGTREDVDPLLLRELTVCACFQAVHAFCL